MCTTGNVFMNYGNYQLGGYQYGYNIADLFTNVPGINTVFNYGGMGCSNLGYGYGTGCNNNWALGLGVGTTVVNILGTIGGAWFSSAQTAKAEAQAQEAKDIKDFNSALKTLGLGQYTNNVEGLTAEKIDSVTLPQTKIDEINKPVKKLEAQKAEDEKTYNATAIAALAPEGKSCDTLTGLRTAWEAVKTETATAPEGETAEAKQARLEKHENAKKMLQKVAELEKREKSWEVGGDNYKKLKAAEEKAEKAIEEANKKLDNAKELAKKQLKEMQSKKAAADDEILDKADGSSKKAKQKADAFDAKYTTKNDGTIALNEGSAASTDDLEVIASRFRTASKEEKKNLKKQFDYIMGELGGINALPKGLRTAYNEIISKAA